MSKDLYAAPWSPNAFKKAMSKKEKGDTTPSIDKIEGDEVVDNEGMPLSGYSAYGGLCVKYPKKRDE